MHATPSPPHLRPRRLLAAFLAALNLAALNLAALNLAGPALSAPAVPAPAVSVIEGWETVGDAWELYGLGAAYLAKCGAPNQSERAAGLAQLREEAERLAAALGAPTRVQNARQSLGRMAGERYGCGRQGQEVQAAHAGRLVERINAIAELAPHLGEDSSPVPAGPPLPATAARFRTLPKALQRDEERAVGEALQGTVLFLEYAQWCGSRAAASRERLDSANHELMSLWAHAASIMPRPTVESLEAKEAGRASSLACSPSNTAMVEKTFVAGLDRLPLAQTMAPAQLATPSPPSPLCHAGADWSDGVPGCD